MSIFEKILQQLKDTQELAIFMREHIPDGTEWGFLRDYNECCLFIDRVSSDGLYDGIMIFQRPQLTRIRWGTTHLAAVAELFKKKNKNLNKPDISIESMHSSLKDVQSAYRYVCLSADDLDDDALLLGEIEALDEQHVLLYEFCNKTAKDRSHMVCPLDEITSIQAGGIYEEDIRYLNVEFWAK